jgi:hypothetical protein
MSGVAFRESAKPMVKAFSICRWDASQYILSFALVVIFVFGHVVTAQRALAGLEAQDNSSKAKMDGAKPQAIVIGFVGGFIRHDDPVHSEVQLATRLRKAYPSGVDVEVFENRHGEDAWKKILALLDTDHNGSLSADEKKNAHIILYGHSWGASEAITVARELEKDRIPVLLTIQVDSVSKFHRNDAIIPANVAQAANFYQPDGSVHGQSLIRAADPARTKIIGNFRFDYKASPYACAEYPWYDRIFTKTHTQIECDPVVWKKVEDLIRTDLPLTTDSGQKP